MAPPRFANVRPPNSTTISPHQVSVVISSRQFLPAGKGFRRGTASSDGQQQPLRTPVTVASVFASSNLFPKPSFPSPTPSLSISEGPIFGTVAESFVSELQNMLRILPPRVRDSLEQREDLLSLVEVVMDLGRPPVARFPRGDWRICSDAVTTEDLEQCITQVRRLVSQHNLPHQTGGAEYALQ